MSYITVFTAIVFFSTCCTISSAITVDKDPQAIEDFQPFNSTENAIQSKVDKYDDQVKTVQLYLFFGYIFLLIIVMFVCYITYKKPVKYNPIPCSH
jgi:hypothetical protein